MSLNPSMALLCDAAEEWAAFLDVRATDLDAHGQEGRRAGDVFRADANELREAISHYRPLRRRDPETDDWVET